MKSNNLLIKIFVNLSLNSIGEFETKYLVQCETEENYFIYSTKGMPKKIANGNYEIICDLKLNTMTNIMKAYCEGFGGVEEDTEV